MSCITIAISTIFQNGGDATRALEIGKIIRDYKPEEYSLKIVFISRGSQYEKRVIESGFDLYLAKPQMEGIRYQDDFKTGFGELIGDEYLAREILQGEIAAYKEIKPDILIHGFWPIASIAKQLQIPETKSIAFLPLPLKRGFLKEEHGFPDEIFLSKLPEAIQKLIFKIIPLRIKEKNPAIRHSHIKKAALELGWKGNMVNIFDMIKADLFLVNDLPHFYKIDNYTNCIFTGPIYARNETNGIDDPEILKILAISNSMKKIFCTLGSSGRKKDLLEVIEMFNTPEGQQYSAIILSPPSVCPINESMKKSKNPNVFITDKFVSAKEINKRVDLVICHGGQGTLQTAITCGTPLIGVASQPEQKVNLVHLDSYGSAIRIPFWNWNKRTIGKKVDFIFKKYTVFKERAESLSNIYNQMKPMEIIGKSIWDEIRND